MPFAVSATTWSGAQRVPVDEALHVPGEVVEQVGRLDLAGHLAPVRDPGRDHLLDLHEPGLLPDRRGAGPAELDAVVLRPGCGWR